MSRRISKSRWFAVVAHPTETWRIVRVWVPHNILQPTYNDMTHQFRRMYASEAFQAAMSTNYLASVLIADLKEGQP